VRALRGATRDEEAWQILLRLREQEPEDAEINYRLGRLAARRGESDMAVRYLNHALYGIEPADAPIERVDILTELAGLLLDQQDQESAEGVLSVLARDLPDDPEARLGLARLYQRAGNHEQALAQYAAVLAADPTKPEALLGAADAAFAAGDLVLARTYLEGAAAAGLRSPELEARRALVERAVTVDPLSERLGMTERVRRLTTGLAWARERFDSCQPAPPEGSAGATLDQALEVFRRQPRQDMRDTDVLGQGVSLIAGVEADVRSRCGLEDPMGDAWTLIERARGRRP
jgi:tetratricopeptide (TPR) repeat protein